MSNSSNFDETATLGWSLLKANTESTVLVKGWNSEQKLQTFVSRITVKAFKFYENRVEELVEGAFQSESENAKEHLVKKCLTNACCDEEGKEYKARKTDTKYEPGENKDTKSEVERNSSSKYEIKRASCQNHLNHHELEMLIDIIDRLAPTSVYCSDKLLTCKLKSRKYRYWTTPPMVDERNKGENDGERKPQIAVQGCKQYFKAVLFLPYQRTDFKVKTIHPN
ncbi:unnamed protein product [Mytilus edulis]|uniref:Uncharacterized protein n=1 Tax=Mytilus edulis TaxID=6550 RepID=A0A8S3RHY5_MYTED|nr:unnamed protein product [Mytilus edulis]